MLNLAASLIVLLVMQRRGATWPRILLALLGVNVLIVMLVFAARFI